MKKLQIKICGMRNSENIQEIAALKPDFLGFIFYEKSLRNVTKSLPKIQKNIQKVGVFVSENFDFIFQKIKKYDLQIAQLHANHSPELCQKIQKLNVKIWKVFSLEDAFDFENTKKFEGFCEAFLFDTKGKKKGGNGTQFHWEILKNYKGKTPFFLSGGIGLKDISKIKKINHPKMIGLDVNSKFEKAPALKNTTKLQEFIAQIKNENANSNHRK